MQRVLPTTETHPLFDVAGTRRIEQLAAAALPPHTLMRRAGLAVARLAMALAPHAQRVAVLAGPGNNGGDGLEAALHLKAWGREVHVTLLGDPTRLPDDARDALARARAAGVDIVDTPPPMLQGQDIAIDGLFGIGALRPIDGAAARCVAQLNALPCRVLAIDLPSGVNAATGQPTGTVGVRATHTLALLTLKPGLFTGAGRDLAGEIWFDSLGLEPGDEAAAARLAGPPADTVAQRQHAQHKGSFGDVAVVGGAPGMTGAALLAARSAQVAGAGRVYVHLLDGGSVSADMHRPELMFRSGAVDASATAWAERTVVCGCGGGDTVRSALPSVLSGAARLVLDADGLNAVAADAALATLLRARATRGLATVLTPHPLEAARLLGSTAAAVQADRLGAASQLAAQFGCVVLLKGSGTVIAAPVRVPVINATGNASLASAGTGDVLAGWVAGHWSSHAQGDATSGALSAAAASAHLHGLAADTALRHVWPASDLIAAMGRTRDQRGR